MVDPQKKNKGELSISGTEVQKDRITTNKRQKAKIAKKITQNYWISKIFSANLRFRVRGKTAFCDGQSLYNQLCFFVTNILNLLVRSCTDF